MWDNICVTWTCYSNRCNSIWNCVFLHQVWTAGAYLRKSSARSHWEGHIMVLLRPRAVVLCGTQTGLPRHSTARPSLAEEGECHLSMTVWITSIGLSHGCIIPARISGHCYSLSIIKACNRDVTDSLQWYRKAEVSSTWGLLHLTVFTVSFCWRGNAYSSTLPCPQSSPGLSGSSQ